MLRLFGVPESEIALTLRALEDDGVRLDRLEITTCLRRGEIEIATVFAPDGGSRTTRRSRPACARATATRCSPRTARRSTSTSPRLLAGRTIAVAESCTGGLMAARLTDRAGSSAYVLGGVVVYSDAAKTAFADVPAELIERHGAVSPEVAAALADGAIARFGAELGIGITGHRRAGRRQRGEAGRHGLLQRRARAAASGSTARVQLPGDRAMVRERTTTVAMHLLRRLLLRLAA